MHRITTPDDPYLASFWAIYTSSFPEVEQRTLDDHMRAMEDDAFHCRAFVDDQKTTQGLLCFWDLGGIRYIEHFAMAPALRCGGYGSRILAQFAAELDRSCGNRLLMLEIDPLVDEISRRRLGFYQRLGYVLNDAVYVHPPYQHRHAPYDLLLMSRNRPMTQAERESFEHQVATRVMRYALGDSQAT